MPSMSQRRGRPIRIPPRIILTPPPTPGAYPALHVAAGLSKKHHGGKVIYDPGVECSGYDADEERSEPIYRLNGTTRRGRHTAGPLYGLHDGASNSDLSTAKVQNAQRVQVTEYALTDYPRFLWARREPEHAETKFTIVAPPVNPTSSPVPRKTSITSTSPSTISSSKKGVYALARDAMVLASAFVDATGQPCVPSPQDMYNKPEQVPQWSFRRVRSALRTAGLNLRGR
ncbi:hypothetical protein CYLTODRAFT_167122 [Cylindrobasidium torrendii FP15055 ss-10]|uniref:Uncharacterized protein n=1 Tax=Cylindrobasidium torrendii FP15055 ss-10 TaxID=1314674 RepID=A0A0D7AWE4_9AGAR|nr:hypothetical protein CYLTODRAFT_167122 [Cylindrobasidium torrendii FP15055 ss-10]